MECIYKNSIVITILIVIALFSLHKPVYSHAQSQQNCTLYTFLTTFKNEMVIHDHPVMDNKELASIIANLPEYLIDTIKSHETRSIDVPRDLWQAFSQTYVCLNGCIEIGVKELVVLHSKVENLKTVMHKRIESDGLTRVALHYGSIYLFTEGLSRILASEECADLFLLAGKALRKKLSNEPLITVKQGVALVTLAGMAGLGWYFRREVKDFADYNRLYPAYRSGELALDKPVDKTPREPKEGFILKEVPLIEILTTNLVRQLSNEWFAILDIPEPVKVMELMTHLQSIKFKLNNVITILASGKEVNVLPIVLKALCKHYILMHLKAGTQKRQIVAELAHFSPQAQEHIRKDYFKFTGNDLDEEGVTFAFQDALEYAFWNSKIDRQALVRAYPVLHKLGHKLHECRQVGYNFNERVKAGQNFINHELEFDPSIMGDVVYGAYAIDSPVLIKAAFINKYVDFLAHGQIPQAQFDKDFAKHKEIGEAIGRQYFKQSGKFLQNAGQFTLKEVIDGGAKLEIKQVNGHPVLDVKDIPLSSFEGLESIEGIGNRPYLLIVNSGTKELPAQTREKLKSLQVIFMNEAEVQALGPKDSLLPAELVQISEVLKEIQDKEFVLPSMAKPYVIVKWEGEDYGYLQKALPVLNEIAWVLRGKKEITNERTLKDIAVLADLPAQSASEVLLVCEKLQLHKDIQRILIEKYVMLLFGQEIDKSGLYQKLNNETKQSIEELYKSPDKMLY